MSIVTHPVRLKRPLQILMVCNNREYIEDVMDMIQDLWEMKQVSNLQNALDILEKETPKVIIQNIQLFEKSPTDPLILSYLQATKHIPMLVITTVDDVDMVSFPLGRFISNKLLKNQEKFFELLERYIGRHNYG